MTIFLRKISGKGPTALFFFYSTLKFNHRANRIRSLVKMNYELRGTNEIKVVVPLQWPFPVRPLENTLREAIAKRKPCALE
jgi:hypothetical protein